MQYNKTKKRDIMYHACAQLIIFVINFISVVASIFRKNRKEKYILKKSPEQIISAFVHQDGDELRGVKQHDRMTTSRKLFIKMTASKLIKHEPRWEKLAVEHVHM